MGCITVKCALAFGCGLDWSGGAKVLLVTPPEFLFALLICWLLYESVTLVLEFGSDVILVLELKEIKKNPFQELI